MLPREVVSAFLEKYLDDSRIWMIEYFATDPQINIGIATVLGIPHCLKYFLSQIKIMLRLRKTM